jgi:hypothetical protein
MKDNWTNSFFDSFIINESSLHKLPNIRNFDEFVILANKFRNIFRNNFLNTSKVSLEQSNFFFKNLDLDASRILYAISYNQEWIGHFGLRKFKSKNIMLDNAVRFSPKGGKSLFRDINLALINHIQSFLPEHNILIMIKKGNASAFKLHTGLGFEECSQKNYNEFCVDSTEFSLMIIKANK